VIDEETFVVPTAWHRTRVPRRGSAGVARPAPSGGAVAGAAALLAEREESIRETLAFPDTDPDLARAGAAFLTGRPDPVGAAAAVVPLVRSTTYTERDRLVVFADAWFTSHGPVFAAEAVAAMLAMSVHQVTARPQRPPAAFQQPLKWLLPGAQAHGWYSDITLRAAHRLRALLTGVPDEVHAEIVAALAARRDGTLASRVATSYLAPDRVDWVADDCAAVAAAGAPELAQTLVFAISTPAHFEVLKDQVNPWWVRHHAPALPTMVAAMGPAAAAILAGWLSLDYSRADFSRRLASALAVLPGDEAFGYLLDRVDDKVVRPAVLEAARRFPRRGLRLLAADGRRAAADLLRTHVAGHPDLAAELAPALPADARARVERILADTTGAVDAPLTALPRVLADPPWLGRRTAHRPVVIDLPLPDEPATVVWLPGERDRWQEPGHHYHWRRSPTWEEDAARIRDGATSWVDGRGFFLAAPEELARPLIRTWQVPHMWATADWAPRLAARFELDALPVLLDLAHRSPATGTAALLPFGSLKVALFMADGFGRLKSVRATAQAWFDRHAALSARVFVPAALSKPGPARRQAEQVLRALAAAGHAGEVRAVAEGCGSGAAAAIGALLDLDPVEMLPAKVPAVPAWADPAALPRIRLRAGGGAVVPLPAAGHLITMLAMSRLDGVYAGLPQVRAAVEPADLAEFVWSLFRLWQAAGSPSKDGWVLDALGLLGDDETVRRFTPVIRAWPGEGGHARAVAGLDVLAAIGTDVALLHLHGIAQKVKFRALRERAAAKIDEVAAGLGLSAEQLADRLVPDLGLDAAGSLTLDYGPRRFTVRFDEQLKPFAVDDNGRPRKDLPKPAATDDAELAPAARQRFAALKKDVRTVAADQIGRLERAMVTRRQWTAREFRDLFVAHPLLVHVVRRLVWLVHDGPVTGAIRVAEDRSFADEHDEPVVLPDTATVSVAHPMLLGPALATWSELFADYEILPPFPQLGREVHAPLPEESVGNLVRFAGRTVESVRLLALERHGWEREHPQDAGWQGHLRLELPDGTTATLGMDPGMIVGDVTFAPEQKVTHVGIHPGGDGVDPIVLSEIIRDVEAATAPRG
jgi:hypothetical protein